MKRAYFLMSCDLQDDAELGEIALSFEDYPNIWTLTVEELHEFLLGAY